MPRLVQRMPGLVQLKAQTGPAIHVSVQLSTCAGAGAGGALFFFLYFPRKSYTFPRGGGSSGAPVWAWHVIQTCTKSPKPRFRF